MMAPLGTVLVNGNPVPANEASISAFDIGFQRGYGCFEAMRSYGGEIFRLDAHIARLGRSAEMLHIPLRHRDELSDWCRIVADGDCVVRVLVSGGTDARNIGTDSVTIVLAQPVPPVPRGLELQSRIAPWHSDGSRFELTGAKALSYGFNLAATLAAQAEGFDDALLVGESGFVLEGPTFSVAWVSGGRVFTPSLELGILASITRAAVIEAAENAGIGVAEGVARLSDVLAADEVMALSTTREVAAVTRIDDRRFDAGQQTRQLGDAFRALVTSEAGS